MILAENIQKFEGIDSHHFEEKERKKRDYQQMLLKQMQEKKERDERSKQQQDKFDKAEEERIRAQNQRLEARNKVQVDKRHQYQGVAPKLDVQASLDDVFKTKGQDNSPWIQTTDKLKNYNVILNTQISQKYITSSKEDKKNETKPVISGINNYDYDPPINHNARPAEKAYAPLAVKGSQPSVDLQYVTDKENMKGFMNTNVRKTGTTRKIIKTGKINTSLNRNPDRQNTLPLIQK